jgi:hypothetical protein
MLCPLASGGTDLFILILLINFCLNSGANAEPQAPTDSSPESNFEVGQLPASNQWVFDRAHASLYLGASQFHLASRLHSNSHYLVNFKSTQASAPELDYFFRIMNFSDPEGRSILRYASLWMRYSLGVLYMRGNIQDTKLRFTSSAESAFLATLYGRVGLLVSVDRMSWLHPYLGLQINPAYSRLGSSLSGAEQQGAATSYGPVAGLQFLDLFHSRVSIYAEYRRDQMIRDDLKLFASGNAGEMGLGYVF